MIDFKKVALDLDPLLNDLDSAIKNLNVIQSTMVESSSEAANRYGNALYTTWKYLAILHDDMRTLLDIAFEGARNTKE